MKTETWSSTRGFILAAVGAAVGLGNLWRFPYIAGSNGGSAFVLVYVGWVLLLGLPLVIGELALGRRGGRNAVHTMREVASREGRSGAWVLIGWLSILVPLVGITYYSIVAGWSLNYTLLAAQGTFQGISAEGSQALFGELLSDPWRLMFWHGLFIAIVVAVIAGGVRKGLERASKLMMPGL
ncbi:MAG: sodium-dependent transporter, partial [Gammaproteobacteria bacterium]|nr:sodium-dependent transporter [Gammaproteobacteria bacterium]